MNDHSLIELETAAVARNPLLADRLQPGLSEKKISALLKQAKITGTVQPIIQLYCWKNGTKWDLALGLSKAGIFPNATYNLSDLRRAILDLKSFKDFWKGFPKLFPLRDRYFPAFWDGHDNWIALDLESNEGRIVLVRLSAQDMTPYQPQVRETEPPPEAYSSFGEFVADAIQANKNNEPLTCFRMLKWPVAQSAQNQPEPSRGESPSKTGMNKKMIPETENPLVLRTDFSDETAWKSLRKTLQDPDDKFSPELEFVNDRAFDGLAATDLPSLLSEGSSHTFAFIVDRTALTHPGNPVLIIDLHDKPGRTFRVTAAALGGVANNLSIANMDFDEFAKAVDKDGIFRGFSRE